jgi:uncharacterized membrane protein SirB2
MHQTCRFVSVTVFNNCSQLISILLKILNIKKWSGANFIKQKYHHVETIMICARLFMIPRTQDLHENTKCSEWYIESFSFTFLLTVFQMSNSNQSCVNVQNKNYIPAICKREFIW